VIEKIKLKTALVQIQKFAMPRQARSVSLDNYSGYAASAACQISGIVAVRPPSLPILYCLLDLLRALFR
jgi:hypothetical protein